MDKKDERITSFEELKREAKKQERRLKVRAFVSDTIGYVKDHATEIATCVSGVGAIAMGVSRFAKTKAIRDEQKSRERRLYDPRSGRYSECRKPISKIPTKDWLLIRERHKKGEDYETILRDMNLLKK